MTVPHASDAIFSLPPRIRVRAAQVRAEVRPAGKQTWASLALENLSVGGALLVGPLDVAVGAPLELRLETEGGAPLEVNAEVRRVDAQGASAAERAVGVEFLQLTPADIEWLERVVEDALVMVELEPVMSEAGLVAISAEVFSVVDLYETLSVSRTCSMEELAKAAQTMLADIAAAAEAASTPQRKQRLEQARVALGRMHPLWTEPGARRAYDEGFTPALRHSTADVGAPGAPASDGSTRARTVTGDLSAMSFAEIVQGLEMAQRSAELEIRVDDKLIGLVGFEKGGLTSARCGQLTADGAFYRLALIDEAKFRVTYREPRVGLKNMSARVSTLLLDALRMADEMERDGMPIPPVQGDLAYLDEGTWEEAAAPPVLAQAKARARAAEEALLKAEQAAEEERSRRSELESAVLETTSVADARFRAEEAARRKAQATLEEREKERVVLEEALSRSAEDARAKGFLHLGLTLLSGVAIGLVALFAIGAAGAEDRAHARSFQKAVALAEAGEAAEAAAILEILRTDVPNEPRIHRQLGDAYGRLGERELSREAYARYIEAARGTPDADRLERELAGASAKPKSPGPSHGSDDTVSDDEASEAKASEDKASEDKASEDKASDDEGSDPGPDEPVD